jgi:hypothetical protein
VSEPTPDEIKQAVIDVTNEYRRLQRQLDAKTQQLDSLLATNQPGGEMPTDFLGLVPRRYSVDFVFAAGDLEPQERSVNVDAGTVFRCTSIETFLRAVGTAGVTVQVSLPWDQRLMYFDFLWSCRDTGTDREWVAPPQPSLFAGGGYDGPLWLPRNNIVSGGSALYVSLYPQVSLTLGLLDNFPGFFRDGDVSQYEVQFSFVGYEEPDRSAL